MRLKGILIPTKHKTEVEVQIYLNQHGIIGIKIGDDLENLIIDETDTSQFVIEKVPASKFFTDSADLEYLDDFGEIDDYLDNKYASEAFTIDNVQYYSIIIAPAVSRLWTRRFRLCFTVSLPETRLKP